MGMFDFFEDAYDAVTDNPIGDLVSSAHDVVLQPLGIAESETSKAQRRLGRGPELPDMNLEQFANAGSQADQFQRLGASRFDSINEDGTLRQAQIGALRGLQDIANNKGLTDADKARLQEINRDQRIADQGQRSAITQNAQRRGISGSGLELASLLGQNQGSADRANSQALTVEQQASQRALNALSQSGDLGGRIRGQDFGQAAQKAEAADMIARFNNQMLNNARANDLANRQRLEEMNRNVRNQQYIANTYDLPQQRFNQQAGYDMTRAGNKDQRTQTLFQNAANIGAAVATGGASVPGQVASGSFLRAPTQSGTPSLTGNNYDDIFNFKPNF
jgi:hypothetical protein